MVPIILSSRNLNILFIVYHLMTMEILSLHTMEIIITTTTTHNNDPTNIYSTTTPTTSQPTPTKPSTASNKTGL